jgi:hypothetical protein
VLTAHLILTALLQVSATQAPLTRQARVDADSGSRVRITVDQPSKHSHVGTLVSTDADSLRFTTDTGGLVAIPTGSVTRFERSRGRHSNAGRGALIGGVSLGAAGLILGVGASAESNSGWGPDIGAEEVVLATLIMGAAGTGIGALIGAASKGERWEPLTIPYSSAHRASQGSSIARAGAATGF